MQFSLIWACTDVHTNTYSQSVHACTHTHTHMSNSHGTLISMTHIYKDMCIMLYKEIHMVNVKTWINNIKSSIYTHIQSRCIHDDPQLFYIYSNHNATMILFVKVQIQLSKECCTKEGEEKNIIRNFEIWR